MPLRNVTVTLDEETAHWARLEAARLDTSVSKLLGALLRREMVERDDYERALRSYRSRQPAALKRRGAYPERDALHERDAVR